MIGPTTPSTPQEAAHYAEGYQHMRSHVMVHAGSLTALARIVEDTRERYPSQRDYWFTTGALAAINERLESIGLNEKPTANT